MVMLYACVVNIVDVDTHPSSILVKLIAGFLLSFGTQMIIIPVMTIANKFESMYEANYNG